MLASQRILILLIIAALSASIACSSGGKSSSSAPPAVSIALSPPPSSTSVPVGSTTGIQFSPVVSNDSNNEGVDWAVTCPLSTAASPNPQACGSLSISTLHSASGTVVTYMPPANLQTGSLLVNVTVFATADHTKNITTQITVVSYTNVLNGTYVLQVMGSDGNPYQATGAFVFDGKGNITSGEETINSSSSGFFSSPYAVQGSSGIPSTYFIGPDGRGTIALNLQQINGTNAPMQTFTLVVLSTSEALIAEIDSSSASGTLELQDSTGASKMPSGAYAFVTNGTDAGSSNGPLGGLPAPTAMGGVFNIDNSPSAGSISGNGSLADQDYYNSGGTSRNLESCVPPVGLTGSVSSPSSMGIVTIVLTGATCFGIERPSTIQFTGYIVDTTHIRLIESDDIDGTGGFLTAGLAVSQGSAVGTFNVSSLLGPYVFGVLGDDINAASPSSFATAGVVKADGKGNLTGGIGDALFPGDGAAFTANALSGKYGVDSTLIGRAHLTLRFSGPLPIPAAKVLFYLTGNGTPPLVLWSEGEDPNFPALGAGIAYPQAANATTLSFGNPEKYGLRFTSNLSSVEIDGSGEMTSSITGVTGALTGTVDDPNNTFLTGGTPFSLQDKFTLPADPFGRIAGSFLNTSGSNGPFVDYYLVNDNQGFFVETDLLNSSVSAAGVSLGYFAQGCDVTSATSCQSAAVANAQQAPVRRLRMKP